MAAVGSAKSSFQSQARSSKKKSSSSKGKVTAKKAKKMHNAIVEYEEPFEKKGELYKEGQGTERWSKKPGGAKKAPKSKKQSKKGSKKLLFGK